jgi:lysophospholipase L1-like esterase
MGDSITDGRGSFNNANNRWPDLLSSRLQASTKSSLRDIAILNQAAGGNRLLADGLGPSGLSRVERDIISHSGVKYALLFIGVNDIGTAASTVSTQESVGDAIIRGYQQVITRIHAAGIPVWGATITPFGCANITLQPYSTGEREATRGRVNGWIRESVGKAGGFDGLVDFDAVVRDEGNRTRLKEWYDSGDCLHLNPDGYRAMARAFPVDLFEKFKDGVSGFV